MGWGEAGAERTFHDGSPAATKRPRLRTGFLLAVLLGAIVPLALVGLWLAQGAQRSAEVLVRERLQETLSDLALEAGTAWGQERAPLLRLAESSAVRDLLVEEGGPGEDGPGEELIIDSGPGNVPVDGQLDAAARDDLETLWKALEGTVGRAELRDLEGRRRATFERGDPTLERAFPPLEAAVVPISVPVHSSWAGEHIGSVEAWFRVRAFIPGDLLVPGVGGSVLGLFEPADGEPVLPLPMEPELFHRDRFEWQGETWVVARHRLYEPPLVLALAGPVGAFSEPFQRAGRQGMAALLLVSVLAFLLIGYASRRLTRPLAALAEGADDVRTGHLDRRVPEAGPDEVLRVARAFNAMAVSLRQTLDRLSQREALAAMGEMAASLAHEVRNPLSAVRLDLQRAERRLARGEEGAGELVHRALQEIERLDSSVGEALGMARVNRVEVPAVELAEPLQAALYGARPTFREAGVELVAGAEAGRGAVVEGDPATLKQLFLNLLLNAAEAVEPGGRAGIRVTDEGRRVEVEVWDEGPGMDPEVLRRVLEPFFSTRPEGTGLGLPVAQRIARAHGGELRIQSEPGQGTVVVVSLVEAERRGPRTQPEGPEGAHGAGGPDR